MNARGAMTRDFPPVLGRLIPRLGSPFDHEVVATARAIERTLKSQKLDWHDLAKTVTSQAPPTQWDEPHRTESDKARQIRAWLTTISREDWPNEWTVRFIASLLRRRTLDKLSERQLDCVDRIIHEAFDRGVRVDRSAA
jgi:hypothetical protein